MASPVNWHCASCIGALSFRISPVRSCIQWSREVGGHCSRLGRVQGRRSHVFFWVRTHPLFRSWVWIGIGPTHFLRWIVYYCVCIQHDIDESQISFIELCKTLRTNSGLGAINSCLHVFWPRLCNRNVCAVSYVLRLWSLDPPSSGFNASSRLGGRALWADCPPAWLKRIDGVL